MEDWDDYRLFLAVMRQGSFAAAARSAGVSQPTISRRMARLQQRLRLVLFEHSGHQAAATPQAQALLESLEQMEGAALSLQRHVEGRISAVEGEVVVTTTEGLACAWLAPRLPQLRAAYPELRVVVRVANTRLDLLRRESDIALRMGEPASPQLIGRKVGRVHCGIYAAPGYLRAHGLPQTLADLSTHQLIDGIGEIADFPQIRQLRGLLSADRAVTASNSADVQRSLARAGMGLFATTCYLGDPDSGLQRVLAQHFDPAVDLWLLTHREVRTSARVRAVMDFLLDALKRDQALFEGRS
ncbi:MAG: LysR family transcriptional regulator [Lysobacterales bacterium]